MYNIYIHNVCFNINYLDKMLLCSDIMLIPDLLPQVLPSFFSARYPGARFYLRASHNAIQKEVLRFRKIQDVSVCSILLSGRK